MDSDANLSRELLHLGTIRKLRADNEALWKERDAARAAHHKTSHKAVKRLRALWREKQAAESRVTALEAEVGRLREAVKRQIANIEHWLATGEAAGPEESRSIYEQLKAALANEEAGR